MSMWLTLQPVTQESVDILLADPDRIGEFCRGPAKPPSPGLLQLLLAKLSGKKPVVASDQGTALPDILEQDRAREICDLDKSWHALHYLFSGSDWEGDWPANFLLHGGTEVGTTDVYGYGPARACTAAEVREIAAYLETITVDVLRQRYDPAKMAELEIYPNCWQRDPDEEFAYIAGFLDPLKACVAQASNQGLGAICYLC